jgi:hypothetical protein
MTKNSLSDTQLVILSVAAQRDDLRIEFPERLRGGAAKAVFATLLNKALIEVDRSAGRPDDYLRDEDDLPRYRISSQGLAALGIESEDDGGALLSGASATENIAQPDACKTEVKPAASAPSAAPRAGTKLASVIALLEREDGASIDELTAATGWLAHTTRAALTGLRKRGLVVERAKREDSTIIYRIVAAGMVETSGEAAR